MTDTLEQAQKNYDRVVEHNEKNLSSIRAKIKQRESAGQNTESLEKELAQWQKIADRGETLALESLNAAKELHNEQVAQSEANRKKKREEREATLKADALRSWVLNGGDPKQFETTWATIRAGMMEQAVIEDMKKPKGDFFTSL